MKARILFAEDEHAFAVGIIDRLVFEGYDVEHVANGQDAFERAKQNGFDLIVLDLMLPGMRGLDICRDLRKANVNTPLLILSARGEIADRIVGLKLGADDYVVKGCDVMELMARVEALLRRTATATVKTNDLVEFGDIRIDFRSNEITRSGQPVPLPPAEFRLLKYLTQHRGTVVTREELLTNVWGFDSETLTRTVDVHMAALRRKIERDPGCPEFSITVKGVGYKMMIGFRP